MAIMKIRGGDLDLVEYDFASFHPGEHIYTDIPIVKSPVPQKGSFNVTVPSRIHLTVLDMNRFSPGKPGGGGLGFALQIYSNATVSCISGSTVIDSSRVLLIEHLVAAFKAVTGYIGGFDIRTGAHGKEHVGLGSTCTIASAVVAAMNEALGCPLTYNNIRQLIGHNYVEETNEPGEIAFGFETGVGAATSIYGGMNILGDQLTHVYRHSFAEDKNVFIITPNIHPEDDNSGLEEFSLLMTRARTLDYRDRELKAYMIMMDMIPAIEKGDLKKMGDIMWEIEFRGSKRAEVQHHTFIIYQYMNALRQAGLEFVAMSSVGPSICVVTEKSEEEIKPILDVIGLEISVITKVDNTGIRITKN
ncbi:MAG TPA: GHMP kinase [Methanocorpusculum sp.]|nr:GHMP kinase [Methanocorpusculum sp.]HJJ49930.1 GHMP kinase [Methanocorpusculum sp.]HKL98103.1 GHMP kinase [Methanocorpusculum sp.]